MDDELNVPWLQQHSRAVDTKEQIGATRTRGGAIDLAAKFAVACNVPRLH